MSEPRLPTEDEMSGICRIGNREMTMFSQGDIFCSLTEEELEQERQEARELAEKFHELMLLELASNMSLMDFFEKWMEYLKDPSEGEDGWRARFERNRRREEEDWDNYKYRMDTYDKERATEEKLLKWRKYHMVMDHLWIVILFVLGYIAYNDPEWRFASYVLSALGILNLVTIGYRWSTFKSSKKWEVI